MWCHTPVLLLVILAHLVLTWLSYMAFKFCFV